MKIKITEEQKVELYDISVPQLEDIFGKFLDQLEYETEPDKFDKFLTRAKNVINERIKDFNNDEDIPF